MINLDEYQKKILEAKGNLCICTGRQVGKSTIISIKAGEYVVKHNNKSVLIISSTERQAEELFIKCLNYINDNYKTWIKKGKDRPTKHVIKLNNGSIIRCLPTGLSGLGIRGFTIDMLIADEAAFIPELVWTAVSPMLLTTGGDIILVSTPYGRNGYFYQCFNDENFTKFHISSPEVIDKRPISESWTERQRAKAIEYLELEKSRMTKLQYAQEYLGQFVDKLRQFFPDELIIKCMRVARQRSIIPGREYFLGIDIARLGKDDTTFEIFDRVNRERLHHVESLVISQSFLTDTTKKIFELNEKYNFKKIYIDDGGIGVAVFENLLLDPKTRRKVIPINNASRSLDKDDKKRKKLLKEDLYNNLLRLMEQDKVALLDDAEIYKSLKSVQYEYTDRGELKIFGEDTHIAEGLIRAAWCIKDKSLNIWVR